MFRTTKATHLHYFKTKRIQITVSNPIVVGMADAHVTMAKQNACAINARSAMLELITRECLNILYVTQ